MIKHEKIFGRKKHNDVHAAVQEARLRLPDRGYEIREETATKAVMVLGEYINALRSEIEFLRS